MKTDKVHTAMLLLVKVHGDLLTFHGIDTKFIDENSQYVRYTVKVSANMAKFAQELINMPTDKDKLLMCEFSLAPITSKGVVKLPERFNIKRLHAFTHSNSERSFRIRNV